MDPITCCLLGICCPPARREQTIRAHFVALGLSEHDAKIVTADLITRADELMSMGLSAVVDAARKHKPE